MGKPSYAELRARQNIDRSRVDTASRKATAKALNNAVVFPSNHGGIEDDAICLNEGERVGFAREVTRTEDWHVVIETTVIIKPRDDEKDRAF